MAPEEQARVFLAMMLCGAVLGAAYDAGMLLRRAAHAGRILTGALDLSFGALCAAGMTATALAMRVNPFRWYEFAGVAAGMAAYMISIGTIVRFLCAAVQKFAPKKKKPGDNLRNDAGN